MFNWLVRINLGFLLADRFLVIDTAIALLQLRHHNWGHAVRKFTLATLVTGSQYVYLIAMAVKQDNRLGRRCIAHDCNGREDKVIHFIGLQPIRTE